MTIKEQSRYVKGWRLAKSRGQRFAVDPAVTRRKIHALNALGHTNASIAREMGMTPAAVTNLMKSKTVRPKTVALVARVYIAMEMRIPPDTRESRKCRSRALAAGHLPPLAWEDIDSGVVAEQEYRSLWEITRRDRPDRRKSAFPRPPVDRYDEQIIEDVIQHNTWGQVLTSPLEKSEIVRRWVANGRSEASLCKLTGWAEGRYHLPAPTHKP